MKKEMLAKAIYVATNAHYEQYDKGGNPYILHPLAVMNLLTETDEELQAIAILHDVVEDTEETIEDLRAFGFSERVLNAVAALTKRHGQTYDEYKQAVFANTDAMKVKMADLTHNSDIRRLKGVSEKDLARTARYYCFYMEIKEKLEN